MKIQDQKTLEKGLVNIKELGDDEGVHVIHILIDIICKEKEDHYEYLEAIKKITDDEEMLKSLCHRMSLTDIHQLLSCLKREKSNFENGLIDMEHLDDICFSTWLSFISTIYLELSRTKSIKYFLLKLMRLKREIVNFISFDIASKELEFDTLFDLTEFLGKMEEMNLWSDIAYIIDSMKFDLDLYKTLEDNRPQRTFFDEIRFISKKANYYERKRSEKKILWVQSLIIFFFILIIAIFPIYIYILENIRYSNNINFFDSIYLSVMHACSVGVSNFVPSHLTKIILIVDSLIGVILIGLIAGFILDRVKPIYRR
jgi:hypothetical protein